MTEFRFYHIVFLIRMIIICASTVGAQTDIFNESWRWAHFTTESGLPSNNIYNIIETADSTLWALSDAGIAWYDGFQWINVPIVKSMLANYSGQISDYCRDSVIYYFGGICKGGKSGFSNILISDSSHIHNAVYLSGDTILVHVNNSLYYLNDNKLQPLDVSQKVTNGKVFKILRTKAGRVWVITKEGIYRWEESKWRLIFRTNGELPFPPNITENVNGVALIHIELPMKYRGFWQWLPDRQIVQRLEGTAEGIRNIAMAQSGDIVAVYHSGEVRTRSGLSWSTSPILQSKTKHVNDIFYRKNGDLVIATADGIHYFRASSSRWRVLRYGVPNTWEAVNEIVASRSGDIWFATGNGIVVESRDGTMKLITHVDKVPMVSVTGLAEDRDGSVWISSGGSFNGAYRWDGKRWKHFQIDNDSVETRFHKIRKDRDGNLWFLGISKLANPPEAQNPGAFMYDGKKFIRWGTEHGLLHGRVYAFAQSVDGALWFGTHLGICKWKHGEWKHWTKAQGLRTDHIFTLAVDKRNNVWFGHQVYGFGLGCIDSSGRVRYYTKSAGLINDFVWEVKADSQDVLWISTEGGLASYDQGVWSRFDENTGLHYNLLWPILPLGHEVYVGTRGQGVAILNRQESATAPPRIIIDKPIVDQQNVYLKWRAFSYHGEMSENEILTRCRIDDEAWSEWSKNHALNLDNCLSGDHTIFVEARGLFRDYIGEGSNAAFNVPPPLYLHPFILSSAVFVFLGLIIFTIVFVVRKRRHDSELRQREAKFHAVTEMTYSAIFICKDDLSIIFSNSGMERMTGYTKTELQDMKATDLFSPEYRSAFIIKDRNYSKDIDVPHRAEFEILKKNGAKRYIDLSWGSVTFQGIPAIIGTAFDVTERKRAEIRIKALASELSSTEQRSRRRMAAFLHDKIGHALALSKMKVEALLQASQQPIARQSAEEVYALLRDAIKTTRAFTFELSPPILYDLGLVPAIDWLIEELQKQQKISISLHKPISKFRLADDVRNVLFEGTRELLINSVKHGRAKIIDVSIAQQDSMVTIAVRDDGAGFDVSRIDQLQTGHKSFGLYNLKERLKDINGRMEIESSPGRGTAVRIHAPTITQEGVSQ